MVLGLEVIALEARFRVELNRGLLCHEDGVRHELGSIEGSLLSASCENITLIDIINIVNVALITGVEGSSARWIALRRNWHLGTAENDTVGEVFIFDDLGNLLASFSFVLRLLAVPLGNVGLGVVPRIDGAIAELSADFRSALVGLHIGVGEVAVVLRQEGVANVLFALAPDVPVEAEVV